MKLEIKKFVLENLLEKVVCALPPKSLGEQLNAIQLEVSKTGLRLLCMDGDFFVESSTPLIKGDGEGLYSVPPKFKDVVYNSSADTLVISSDGKELLIEADDKSESRLSLRTAERWILPDVLWSEAVEVPREKFLTALSRVKAAVSSDSGQPALMQAVATHVGVIGTNAARYHQVDSEFGVTLSIPQAILDAVVKLLGMVESVNIKIVDAVDKVGLVFGEDRVVFNKLSYEFPEWVKTMPQLVAGNDKFFYGNRQELIKVVRQVALLADENSKLMTCLVIGNELRIQAKDSFGNLSKAIVVGRADNAEGVTISLNHRFFQDALASLPDVDVCIAVGQDKLNHKSHVAIRGENVMCILVQLSSG